MFARKNQGYCIVLLFVLFLALIPALSSQDIKVTPEKTAQSRVPAKLRRTKAVLRAVVADGRLDDLQWPNFSEYRAQVEDLYRRSRFSLVWVHAGSPTPQAEQMIAILQQADSAGLRSEDYDASRWPQRIVRLQGQHLQSEEALFDVALTVCSMRYISDLRVGRINPRYLKFALDVTPKELNLSAFVYRLAYGKDLKAEVESIEPPLLAYKRLRAALPRYMRLAKEDDGEQLPKPNGIVFSGTPYQGIARLTKLLRLLGDLPENAVIPASSQIYSGPLVEAVKHFQQRHGLRSDGYLDVNTIDQLNVPLGDRVEQMRLALERYRWLRYDFPQPPVIINIPGFHLYALNEQGTAGLTMTVDVGSDYDKDRTPVLESNIEYLVFRPYWDVPLDIQRAEIYPNVRDDPQYLSEIHFEVVTPDGKLVKDKPVTKELLERIRTGQVRVRQKPGSDNSMGLVKFVFPNRYSVYLHDVPSWGNYFSAPDRDISHGCIHVQEPAQLAAWVLRDKPEWTVEKVQHAMADGPDNVRVNLTKPLPVLIIYMTAAVREDGVVYFYRDIYGYDAELQAVLAKGYHVYD